MMDRFQKMVTQMVFGALDQYGFALGGGQALQAHGITDRPSKDIDGYTQKLDASVFEDAETELLNVFSNSGLDARVVRSDSWFRQLIISDGEESISLDIGYDYRQHPPVVITGMGPVLDIDDVVTGKVRALSDRQAERDYFDIDAILATGRWSVDDLNAKLQSMRPEFNKEDFATLLRSSHLGDPEEYAALGMSVDDIVSMAERLDDAADNLINPVTHRFPFVTITQNKSSIVTRCGKSVISNEGMPCKLDARHAGVCRSRP